MVRSAELGVFGAFVGSVTAKLTGGFDHRRCVRNPHPSGVQPGEQRTVGVDRLASTSDRRETEDAHSMAPQGIPLVLAVEIEASWPTPSAGRRAALDRRHGRGQSHVGRGADCLGTPREAHEPDHLSRLSALHHARHLGRRPREQSDGRPSPLLVIAREDQQTSTRDRNGRIS